MKIRFKLYFTVPVGVPQTRITPDKIMIFSRDMSSLGYITVYTKEMEEDIPDLLDVMGLSILSILW